jgi:predicted nucleic acid-binding protein
VAESPVVNASPLIVLAKADLLDLLKPAGEPILVPDSVAREVRRHSPDAAMRSLDSQPWLQVVSTPPIPPLIEAWDLGEGESSVLAWAHAHPGSVAILDDLAARRCATALAISCRGCLGLALLAKRRGLYPAVRPLVERLRDAGLYLGDAVVKRVLALAGE